MGIAKGLARLLIEESRDRPFSGRLLTLGKQDVFFTSPKLEKMAEEFGVKLNKNIKVTYSLNQFSKQKGYISDVFLFKALGFSEVKSIDVNDYESTDIMFDLNNNEVPKELVGKFDVIMDSGTTEHIFHIPNCLNNLNMMLKKGGRIICCLPTSNYVDHGFYMFSPTLFWDYYSANKFDINKFYIYKHHKLHNFFRFKISKYFPGCLDNVSFGGLDSALYCIFFVVSKTNNSKYNVIPQQGRYYKEWKVHSNIIMKTDSLKEKVRKYIKSSPKLYPIALNIYDSQIVKYIIYITKRKGLGLKVEKKY